MGGFLALFLVVGARGGCSEAFCSLHPCGRDFGFWLLYSGQLAEFNLTPRVGAACLAKRPSPGKHCRVLLARGLQDTLSVGLIGISFVSFRKTLLPEKLLFWLVLPWTCLFSHSFTFSFVFPKKLDAISACIKKFWLVWVPKKCEFFYSLIKGLPLCLHGEFAPPFY